MSNANPNRIGQNLGSGDPRQNFKDLFLTEVLAAYHTANVTEGRFLSRNITEGRSAKFPVVGTASGGFHTPGSEILGRNIKHTEKTIAVDDMLIADVFVAEIDELMNHYDVRAPYSKELGEFLAKVDDYHKFLTVLKAARSSANIPGVTAAGERIVNSAMKTDALVLAGALFGARTALDEKGIPQSDVAAYLKPAQIALLVMNKETINKNYGGAGSYADGDIFSVGGVPIVKTTHIPQAYLATANSSLDAAVQSIFGENTDASLLPEKYRLDCRTTAGIVAHTNAIGTVSLKNMDLAMDYDFRRKGTLIVASQAKGTDVLRPECAIELATGAVA